MKRMMTMMIYSKIFRIRYLFIIPYTKNLIFFTVYISKYTMFPQSEETNVKSSDQKMEKINKEGVNENNILVTGNTVIDALLSVSKKIDANLEFYENYFSSNYGIYFNDEKTILVTGHRRESFGNGFENICNALKDISRSNIVQIIYPVHMNPNVKEPVHRILKNLKNVHLIPPQDYLPFIFLMKNANIIITDSGGVQEEAPSLGKPVLVMRDTTERPEGVKTGTARLIGTNQIEIVKAVNILLNDDGEYNRMSRAVNPYGGGFASSLIYEFIIDHLC